MKGWIRECKICNEFVLLYFLIGIVNWCWKNCFWFKYLGFKKFKIDYNFERWFFIGVFVKVILNDVCNFFIVWDCFVFGFFIFCVLLIIIVCYFIVFNIFLFWCNKE